MTEIAKILQKLETASNLQKSGALDDKELDALRAYVRAAMHMEALAADCAAKLTYACAYVSKQRV